MNSILMLFQKNRYYLLFPILLFFAYSFGYLIRSVIIAALNPGNIEKMSVRSVRSIGVDTGIAAKAISIYEDMVEGNLIRGRKMDEISLSGKPGDPNNPDAGAEPVPIDNPATDEMFVSGTISGHRSYARAVLKEKDKEEAEEYGIGQKVGGYEVKRIDEHYIVLKKGGLNLQVEVGETIKEAKLRVQAKPTETEEGAAVGPSSQTIRRKLSRTDVDKALKNPAEIYKDARFGPHLLPNGKIDGYKINQVAVSHIFYKLGARNGDIVKRVNGMPLQETEKMLEIWSSVKNSQKITVDIERKEKIITYEFIIGN